MLPRTTRFTANKARALTVLAESLNATHREKSASIALAEASSAAEEGLRLAPEDIWAHNSKALVLLTSGRLAEAADRDTATRCYEATLKECTRSVALAADEVEARFYRGLALMGLARLSKEEMAVKHLQRALTVLDEMLSLAPSDVDARYERADCCATRKT